MKAGNIEIFPLLDELCGRASSSAGFHLDVWQIKKGTAEYEMMERTFYWLPTGHGGLCVQERNVFLRGSDDHRIWTGQRPKEGASAYYIAIKGGTPERPKGDVRSFDYPAHLRRVKAVAVESRAVEVIFYSGEQITMPLETYRTNMERLFWEHGTVRRLRYLPENEAELTRAILLEHRCQKGWRPRRETPAPIPLSR